MATPRTEMVDWVMAQRVGEMVAGSSSSGGLHVASVQPLAHDFAQKVSKYSRLSLTSELPVLEMVDRPAWIKANLKSIRSVQGLLGEQFDRKSANMSSFVRPASRLFLGAQIGALTGVLSQRVLGQYDLSLLDAEVRPRLLLLAPNLAAAANNLAVDRDELVLWVSIHEITHAVQFSGAPWLRDHLGGMLRELLGGVEVLAAEHQRGAAGSRWPKISSVADVRDLVEKAKRGELLRLTLGDDLWQVFGRMQATMSLVEGHAEHTMDAVGAEYLPSLSRLRVAMSARRESQSHGLPWRVLESLLGLKLKRQQYEVGKRFCDAVVSEGGPRALGRVWTDPSTLPSAEELASPELWIERTRLRGWRKYFPGA